MFSPKVLCILLLILFVNIESCVAQNEEYSELKVVGGPCEGCEAALEYGNRKLTPTDTLPGFKENSPKLKIEGTVYQSDGITPAENVIIYFYHTDSNGIYPTKGDEEGWGKRHGFIRGWIKTGTDGKYTIFTFRPASYPSSIAPQHIHITVKEAGIIPYYIDDIMFEDDPHLTNNIKNSLGERGGSGIVLPKQKNGILTVERNIILGMNIPGYN